MQVSKSHLKTANKDLKSFTQVLTRNTCPKHLIESIVNQYLNRKFDNTSREKEESLKDIRYFKLPYIGKISAVTKEKIKDMVSRYCKNIDVRLIIRTYKSKVLSPVRIG